MLLLMSDNVDQCFENCPPRTFLPALCRIFLDETATENVLEVRLVFFSMLDGIQVFSYISFFRCSIPCFWANSKKYQEVSAASFT